ncbi:MAG TPA: cysteine synthase CysM [Saprospiraceae bacterium]|nr:cysteine synthase CysM [Saprospiraceae bacterium]
MNVLQLIGNTPMVRLQHLWNNPEVEIWAKLEGQNPGGSVKDRTANGLITDAIERGALKKGDRIVEATSGNTGIAIAMIASQYGIGVTLIMPDNSTPERVTTMRAYGADIILTPADRTIEYSRELALEMAEQKGYFLLNQFDNPANPNVHIRTTGPEIWRDTGGKVTHFVSSMGTTGTIMGVSAYLKNLKPSVQIIGAQPTEGSSIPGIRRWTPEFLPGIFEEERVDRILEVSEKEAVVTARRLAKEEGIMGGMSSGGACHVALQMAKDLVEGLIVFIVCDRGDRYLSSDLYE